jgi:hypothetical protein
VATEIKDPPMTQGEREATTDFDPAANGNGGHAATLADGGEAAAQQPRSMEDIERAGGEEDDGQMFVFEQGRKVTLGTLIGRGTPVTYEVKLTGRTLKGPGNLIAFNDPDVTLVALGRAGRVITDPTYNDDGSVKSVHVQQEIKTRTFYDARTDAARVALDGE